MDLSKTKTQTLSLDVIIGYKLVKGGFFIILAICAYTLSDNDLSSEVYRVMHVLRIHPGNKFWTDLAISAGGITEKRMLFAALGTLVYSLFSMVEGIGLIFRSAWAGWMSIGESAFFVPIEAYDLAAHFRWFVLLVMISNIAIVIYLFKNRERFFSHHTLAPPPAPPKAIDTPAS